MNTKKILTSIALLSLLAVPALSLAVESTEIPAAPFDSPDTFLDKITTIGNWVFTGLLILAAIFMVIAGYYFVTGGSEPEKIGKARQMIIQALIGIAIAVASKGLISVIQKLVTG